MKQEMKTPPVSLAAQSEGVQRNGEAFPFRLPERLLSGNATEVQEARMLATLRLGSVSTTEARNCLDVLHPAGRIKRLRQRGFEIETHMEPVPTSTGGRRLIGRYFLIREPQ